MVISVLDLYFITHSWSWSVSDGRGGVESAIVAVIVQPPINHFPEAQDQDVSVNQNHPIKFKLEAKDPDDNKLRFILILQPSQGRIVQFSGQAGTLAYVHDPNYAGKDDSNLEVHDGIAFSKNAQVSIKIEKNEETNRDQVQQNDNQQPNNEQFQSDSSR